MIIIEKRIREVLSNFLTTSYPMDKAVDDIMLIINLEENDIIKSVCRCDYPMIASGCKDNICEKCNLKVES